MSLLDSTPISKQTSSYKKNKQFLLQKYASKEQFVGAFRKLYSNKANADDLYLVLLCELERTICDGNIDNFKKLYSLLDFVHDIYQDTFAKGDFDNANNRSKSMNWVILACKYNKINILEYLFNSGSKFTALPNDKDESNHNAFYYAIRTGNVELLNTLINKWPGSYFADRPSELDEILSESYEELKFKNVQLAEETEILVENQLIDLRFFSNAPNQRRKLYKSSAHTIKERIELILESIALLNVNSEREVDEKFLFVARFIAQNIHVLKRQLRSTYDRLPWEEVEFFLVIFIFSHSKRQESNFFYHAILNKRKILNHLQNFAKCLECEKKIARENNLLPSLKREQVVNDITNKHPQFKELYDDYQKLRDIHSLQKVSDVIKLALAANPKQREGQLITIRALQVIGEYFKNTLESPKLSNATCEMLLLLLPRNTREIIIDLRNSLSHANSLSKRIDVEEITDDEFFIRVQNDVKKIGKVINNILIGNKKKTVVLLLQKIANSENLEEIKQVADIFKNAKLDNCHPENFVTMEHDKLAKLISELNSEINDKREYEKKWFSQMNKIIRDAPNHSGDILKNYANGYAMLQTLCTDVFENFIDHNVIRAMKFRANMTLKDLVSQQKSSSLKNIVDLSMQIYQSSIPRMQGDSRENVKRLVYAISYLVTFEMGGLRSIDELRNKLNDKYLFASNRGFCIITEEKYATLLKAKLSELKVILSSNTLSDKLTEALSDYKKNKKLQAVVDMLVLDIMSILGRSDRHLENNLLFLDDYAPLLTGKCLRNHLAHDNILVDILLSDASIAVILNANKLVSENLITSTKKFGKLVIDDPSKLKVKLHRSLFALEYQEKMFGALQEGDLESFKRCLGKGADINAISIDAFTALHFAAKGPSLEILKLLLKQNLDANAKDFNGHSPLHVAAAHGRKDNVELLIKCKGVDVDERDNAGNTALHIAAQKGQKGAVQVLIENGADVCALDMTGRIPLFLSTRNNCFDVCKVLLKKQRNANIKTMGGFTPLHEIAESGHIQLLDLFLQNNADVDAKCERGWTPLHAAAFNGHQKIAETLILKGANVNARVINGCTTLHYAVENGNEEIVNILIKHGANVNAVDKTYRNPLHLAAKYGHEAIAEALLKHNSNPNVVDATKLTPLHIAAESGCLAISILLLQRRVDIHAEDVHKRTPLFHACKNGHKEVVEYFINKGAKITTSDVETLTPLHAAASEGHLGVVEVLIRNKVKINAKDQLGRTPLHFAALNGRDDIINLLVKHQACVDVRCYKGLTPLHWAVQTGHSKATLVLIKNKADVNASVKQSGEYEMTPLSIALYEDHADVVNILLQNKAKVNAAILHMAVDKGNKGLVEISLANGVNVHVKFENTTALHRAIKCSNLEIVKVLIEKGANVNADNGQPLLMAILAGYNDIVQILLNNGALADRKDAYNIPPLCYAAKSGHADIVSALIEKGASVNASNNENLTPLYIAALEGHAEVVKLLIDQKADVNRINDQDAPIHIAAGKGHMNVVKILLSNGASINAKDTENRSSFELAVGYGHLEMVKMMLQHETVDLNAKGNIDHTVLHIAAQGKSLEMVKYLVEKGSSVNARTVMGTKPIHIAAREGFKDTVEYFLSNGMSVDDVSFLNRTSLFYSTVHGQIGVAKLLVEKGADVNISDTTGLSPLHSAAQRGHKTIVKLLLDNGAIYNQRKPSQFTESITKIFESTDKLFKSVKANNCLEVKISIKNGASVNSKDAKNFAPLHYAAWKGHDESVKILLTNKANPNTVCSKGNTPLHYAAKFSHVTIIKALITHGAVYDKTSDNGKTPSDFAVDKDAISLFALIKNAFNKVKNGNEQVISDLNNINDIDIVKAVMCARTKENNNTLVSLAMLSNFSKVEQLKEICNTRSDDIGLGIACLDQGEYAPALIIFKKVYKERQEILGVDNPGTLDIQTLIATTIFKQGGLEKALKMYREILEKQIAIFGLNHKDVLSTQSSIALVLHNQEKNEEAHVIFTEVYAKQRDLLGANHDETINTQFHMALVLERLKKFDEALAINKSVLEVLRSKFGESDHPYTIRVQSNIAMVLTNQGLHKEALEIHHEVLEKKKKLLGSNHADTLRTSFNIGAVLSNLNKNEEALKVFEEVLRAQKNALGKNHPDTLNTQHAIANIFYNQGNWIGAMKQFKEYLNQATSILGPNHPNILNSVAMMQQIAENFKVSGTNESEVLFHLQNEMNIAAANGDLKIVRRLLKDGGNANEEDVDGKAPLHFASSKGHVHIVNLLLKSGADILQITHKGNTALHLATLSDRKTVAEILLAQVDRTKLNDLVNAKTTATGTTALHIAAKNGSVEIVKLLLKSGAIYNVNNKEGKLPIDLSEDHKITNVLKLLDDLFFDVEIGNLEFANKFTSTMPLDELLALTNARNVANKTLLQVAIINGHKHVASRLQKILQEHY